MIIYDYGRKMNCEAENETVGSRTMSQLSAFNIALPARVFVHVEGFHLSKSKTKSLYTPLSKPTR